MFFLFFFIRNPNFAGFKIAVPVGVNIVYCFFCLNVFFYVFLLCYVLVFWVLSLLVFTVSISSGVVDYSTVHGLLLLDLYYLVTYFVLCDLAVTHFHNNIYLYEHFSKGNFYSKFVLMCLTIHILCVN